MVAAPNLVDPNFARTVVLLCEHNADGALGLVVNRPSETLLEEVMPGLPGAESHSEPIREGGPVGREGLFILHDDPAAGGELVTGSVRFAADLEVLESLLSREGESRPRFRLFSGYAGWGGGQLEFEMSQNSWFIADAWTRGVLEARGADAWGGTLRRMGGRYALLAQRPIDPELN